MNTHLSAPTSRGSGIGSSVRALGRCLLLLALWPVSIALFFAICMAADLIPLGIGILLVPVAVKALRSLADWKRRTARQWSGIRVESRTCRRHRLGRVSGAGSTRSCGL